MAVMEAGVAHLTTQMPHPTLCVWLAMVVCVEVAGVWQLIIQCLREKLVMEAFLPGEVATLLLHLPTLQMLVMAEMAVEAVGFQ